MSKLKSNDPFTRHPTRHRGIIYRERDGSKRTYYVHHVGRYIAAGGTEREAIDKQAELRGKKARGEAPVTPSKATFRDIAEGYIESKHRLRAGTRKTYRSTLDRILIPRFGRMKIAAITVEHVAALIRALEKDGLSATTINAYLMPLRGVMAYAVRRRLISVNPYDLLTRDDRPQSHERRENHVWSDDEIDALIDAAERMARQPESRYDYSALIRVAAYTGMRLGELLGLQWQDVDMAEGVIHVRRQWTRADGYGPPKTKAGARRVPLSPDVVKYLRELKVRSRYSGDDDSIFASKNGKPLGHRNVTRRGFEPAAKLAELNVTFHGIRHAYGSKLVAQGVPLAKVAEVMGHESPAITLSIYAHVYNAESSDDAVRRVMAAR